MMAEDRWYALALPILGVVASMERDTDLVTFGELAEAVGCTPDDINLELERLMHAGYLGGEIRRYGSGGDPSVSVYDGVQLSERGARTVGLWPSDDPYDALMALLERQIDQATDPETRTKLERFREGMTDVGKSVASSVLAALLRGGLGLP